MANIDSQYSTKRDALEAKNIFFKLIVCRAIGFKYVAAASQKWCFAISLQGTL